MFDITKLIGAKYCITNTTKDGVPSVSSVVQECNPRNVEILESGIARDFALYGFRPDVVEPLYDSFDEAYDAIISHLKQSYESVIKTYIDQREEARKKFDGRSDFASLPSVSEEDHKFYEQMKANNFTFYSSYHGYTDGYSFISYHVTSIRRGYDGQLEYRCQSDEPNDIWGKERVTAKDFDIADEDSCVFSQEEAIKKTAKYREDRKKSSESWEHDRCAELQKKLDAEKLKNKKLKLKIEELQMKGEK